MKVPDHPMIPGKKAQTVPAKIPLKTAPAIPAKSLGKTVPTVPAKILGKTVSTIPVTETEPTPPVISQIRMTAVDLLPIMVLRPAPTRAQRTARTSTNIDKSTGEIVDGRAEGLHPLHFCTKSCAPCIHAQWKILANLIYSILFSIRFYGYTCPKSPVKKSRSPNLFYKNKSGKRLYY